jgi:hypothetical protein
MAFNPKHPKQIKILNAYISILPKNSTPRYEDLNKLGFTESAIRHHFSSLANLRDAAREYKPKAFENIVDEAMFNPEVFEELKETATGFKRFVITTAVTGCKVHDGFLLALKNYCKRNNAMLLIMPCTDPASKVGLKMDSALADEHIVFDNLQINQNLFLSSIKLSAKHIDPITGLGRIGQRNGSFIFASPKQRLKLVPTSKMKPPHALMTTGAVTKPNYRTERYLSERTAYIATNDHVLGAIVVEVLNNRTFHFRQVQAEKSGHFADLGKYYTIDSVSDMRPEAFILGDWHSGQTDPFAAEAWKQVVALTKPKRLGLHDAFDGLSINHHEQKNITLRAKRAAQNQLSLQMELKRLGADLNELAQGVDELFIVKSNHDEFLERYLAECMYRHDPHNHHVAVKLADKMMHGFDPLQIGVEMYGNLTLEAQKKIKWLQRDQDYKIARVECGSHGDKGANGARGSLMAMEAAYGNSITGHTHTAEILRGAWQVGTSSLLRQEYNKGGSSSWIHSSCLLYPNGGRQLISVVNSSWRLED